jgi:hypothetical protein
LTIGATGSGYSYLYAVKVDGKLLVNSGVSVATVPSISSRIQADPSKGFSIVSYTGTGAAGTISHGLNAAAPKFIIIKSRNVADFWPVYHHSLGTNHIKLNDNAASGVDLFGSEPTSSVFSVGTGNEMNGAYDYIAYCFAPVEGYSSFGKFTANASPDGPFIFLNFRPALIVCKKSSGSGTWFVLDSARDPHNVTTNFLEWNDADAEASSQPRLDFLSNGFKVRAPSGYTPNETSGDTYIYLAFASHPFKTARAR